MYSNIIIWRIWYEKSFFTLPKKKLSLYIMTRYFVKYQKWVKHAAARPTSQANNVLPNNMLSIANILWNRAQFWAEDNHNMVDNSIDERKTIKIDNTESNKSPSGVSIGTRDKHRRTILYVCQWAAPRDGQKT